MLDRFFTSFSHKTGLPPGAIVHVGDKSATKSSIRCTQYTEKSLQEDDDSLLENCPAANEIHPVTWLHISGLHDTSLITDFGSRYDFHPLVLEDLVNTGHRPKIEELEDFAFVVITAFSYDEERKEAVPNQVNLLFNKDVVFSFQEDGDYLFSGVNKRIQNSRGRIRRKKADYLAYALLDTVVDNYFNVFDKIGERIEQLEEEVLEKASSSAMNTIHTLKQEVAVLKKSIWPLREVVLRLEQSDPNLLDDNNTKYYRDLYDHVVQLIDTIEVFRDILNGSRDLYLAMISNKMNEIMKVLTIIATIFIPLTFIAGIYGMNFKYMPELEWHWGYFGALGLMLLCAGAMGIFFRFKKWL